jgi:hypothetical protein
MQKTYGLAVEKTYGLTLLKLPYMTLQEAKAARRKVKSLATIRGINVVIVNRHAQ